MSNHESRLARLSVVYRRPDPVPAKRWDNSALTPQEQFELAGLLERCRPPDPSDPHRLLTMSNLSDEEVDRGAELMERVTRD